MITHMTWSSVSHIFKRVSCLIFFILLLLLLLRSIYIAPFKVIYSEALPIQPRLNNTVCRLFASHSNVVNDTTKCVSFHDYLLLVCQRRYYRTDTYIKATDLCLVDDCTAFTTVLRLE